jgi:hypothetical protein
MTKCRDFLLMGCGFLFAGLGVWIGVELMPKARVWDYSFLGVDGSPIARLISRMVVDKGDDSFHGGATHDVKFEPQTAAGRLVAKVAGSRGVEGAVKRHGTDGKVGKAYSDDTGAWVGLARRLDPGNYDALLTHAHYIYEGGFAVEMGDGKGEVASWAGDGVQVSGDEVNSREKKVARLIHDFLNNAPLTDKTAWYSAAAGVHWLFEVEPWRYGLRRPKQLNRVRGLMQMLVAGGDSCPVVWGSGEDVAAARQFANALVANMEEAIANQKNAPKNTLFKTGDIP